MIDTVLETLQSFLFWVLLSIDALIYSLISWVYKIILVLSKINILENGMEMEKLVGRIYIIIGVVILFLVAYSLLKSMVNPDEALKGKKSPVTILRDVITSVVLIAVVPTIFDFAMGFQTALLTRNTIGSLILGGGTTQTQGNPNEIINQGGTTIAATVLETFLHPDYQKSCIKLTEASATYPNGYDCDEIKISTSEGDISFREFWAKMQENNNLLVINSLSKYVVGSGPLTYYWLISTIAGAFVLFVLISYCFDIAVRAVK